MQGTCPAGLTLSLFRAVFSPREVPLVTQPLLTRRPQRSSLGVGRAQVQSSRGTRNHRPPPPPLHPSSGTFSPSSLRGVWTFLPPASGQTWNVLRGPQNDSGLEGTHRSSGAAEQTSPPGISSSVGGDPLLSPRSGGTWDPRVLPHQGMREPALGGMGCPSGVWPADPLAPKQHLRQSLGSWKPTTVLALGQRLRRQTHGPC